MKYNNMSLITGHHIQNRTFVSSITFNKFKKSI